MLIVSSDFEMHSYNFVKKKRVQYASCSLCIPLIC